MLEPSCKFDEVRPAVRAAPTAPRLIAQIVCTYQIILTATTAILAKLPPE